MPYLAARRLLGMVGTAITNVEPVQERKVLTDYRFFDDELSYVSFFILYLVPHHVKSASIKKP